MERCEELPAARQQLGHRPEDVVVAAHLHKDHFGGLAYLAESELVASHKEWKTAVGSCSGSSRWSTSRP